MPDPVKTPRKPPKGRPFEKGNPGGPGRPPLPDFFHGTGEEALQKIDDVVRGKLKMCDELRLRAFMFAAQFKYGKKPIPRIVLPATKEERVQLLEDMLFQLAMAGDEHALFKLLAALAPEKYGDATPEPDDPKMVDTVDIVPKLRAPAPAAVEEEEAVEVEG